MKLFVSEQLAELPPSTASVDPPPRTGTVPATVPARAAGASMPPNTATTTVSRALRARRPDGTSMTWLLLPICSSEADGIRILRRQPGQTSGPVRHPAYRTNQHFLAVVDGWSV